MSNREYPGCLVTLCELVDDSVGPDAKRARSPQSAAEDVPCERIAFEQTERVPNRVDYWPAELKHLATDAASEDDVRHSAQRAGRSSSSLARRSARLTTSPRETSDNPASIAASVAESERSASAQPVADLSVGRPYASGHAAERWGKPLAVADGLARVVQAKADHELGLRRRQPIRLGHAFRQLG